ncbi:mucin-5AC isoform X2 [Cyclopterus lumpus]|uniref:mucin-5AC isoform X2 n=1 Tax=Cyclopterus lumpus TaxID=8103 RepID=UPI0014861191|nr:mucin-5AC isoform X2 [Cyclopterus lumpus]
MLTAVYISLIIEEWHSLWAEKGSVAVWCLLASDLQFFATALETCKTAWFDERNVSSNGDSELLNDLRGKHWTKICSNPVDMEAHTVSGVKSQHTGNTFHTYSASEGLVCLNSDQKVRPCYDYKVMFTCTGQFCSECRTRWFDHDDPTGNGDFEVLTDLRSIYPRDICPQPIAIEVQTISGEPVSSTSNTFLYYDATYGFACVNADQRSKSCEDYKVRFTCLNEFCQVSAQCRTQWLNSDAPSDEGDVESIFQLLKTFPGQVCRNPISIEAKSTSGISAEHTGDTFLSYDVTFGFACINGKQSGKQCKDYQVILTCPSDFCQGCRTRWFNMDNPASRGDYETLLQLQMLYPSEVCSKPVAIEAMTVSNVPAHKTGDVFQIYDASLGFACVNAEQPGGKRCQDYKVRLTCPLAFCSV